PVGSWCGRPRTVDAATAVPVPFARGRERPGPVSRSAVLLSPASVGDGRARGAPQGLTTAPTAPALASRPARVPACRSSCLPSCAPCGGRGVQRVPPPPPCSFQRPPRPALRRRSLGGGRGLRVPADPPLARRGGGPDPAAVRGVQPPPVPARPRLAVHPACAQ